MDERIRILVVDDDESTRKTLSLILQRKGYAVDTAEAGHIALEKARQHPFDVALLDIRLPDMEGVDLLPPLKQLHPDIIAIVATGYASLATAVRAVNEGAAGYVTKPLDIDAVLAKIEDLVERQRLVRENAQLFAQTRKTAQRVQALYETSRALSSSLEEEDIIRIILGAIYRTLNCEHVILATIDEQARTIGIRHGIWKDQFDMFPAWMQMSQYGLDDPDILADICRTGKTEVIGEWDERFNRAIWEQFGHERLLRVFMPIEMQDRVLGTIEVAYDKQSKSSIEQDEVEILAAFVDQAAITLENARLYAETRRRAARLQAFYEIDQAILAAHSSEEIALAALTHIRALIPSTAGSVVLFDQDTDQTIVLVSAEDRPTILQAGARFPLKPGRLFWTLQRGEVVVEADLLHAPDLPLVLQAMRDAGMRSQLAGPLIVQGELNGAMNLFADRPSAFTSEHVEIVREVANQVAMSLHSARLDTALRAESKRLRTLIDNMPEGILLLNPASEIVLSNPAGDAMLAWLDLANPGRAQTGPLSALGPHSLAAVLAVERTDPPTVAIADPVNKTLELGAYQIGSPESDNQGAIVLMHDVTELHQAQDRSRQQDRLAAVGRLAGGVAHDFNNLLTAITGYTDLVRDSLRSDNPLDWPPGVELRSDLEQVSLAARRAAGLTQQLLIFSRRQTVRRQVLDLNVLVANMGKMLTRLIGEDVSLSLSLATEPELVEADQGQIEQVVMNLAVNARDAMPRGGQLTIETGNVEWETSVALSHSEAKSGSYVRLTVQDSGAGMNRQVLSHLFEPFFTTKAPGKGTGLGLSTVYGIVQQSNGHIDVHSEPGHGTTFCIYLPRVAERVGSVAGEQPARAALEGTETILLVEDEDSVRELARRVLERRGYTVLAAREPDEALLLNERYQGPIDLLLTDVVMPGMNGLALAERLTTLRPGIPVLYMSGYTGDVLDRYDAHLPHGVQTLGLNLLHKPFDPDVLTQRVRQTLGESAARPLEEPEAVGDVLAPSTAVSPRLPKAAPGQPYALRARQDLRPGDHICFIYQTEAEHRSMIVPWVREGLQQRQRVLYIADAHPVETVLELLERDGIDTEAFLASGQLVALTSDETWLRGGAFVPKEAIGLLKAEAERAIAEGYTALRVTNEMSWALRHMPGSERLTEYAVQLNQILPAQPILITCQYDRRQFEAPALLDALRTHPIAVVNGQTYVNSYYIHPSEFSATDLADATLERWLQTLEERRQTEDAVRQSERQFRSFIQQSEDAIVLTDEQGQIIEWNHGAEVIFGLSRDVVLGRPLWDVQFQLYTDERRTPDTYESLRTAMQQSLQTGWNPRLNTLREVEILRPDGVRRAIQILALTIPTENGFILANTSRDMTERKQSEVALLKSEARYRALTEHIPAIIYETPFGEGGTSFYAGPQIERLLGFSQQEWTESSKLWLKQLHPEDRVRVLTALSQSHDSGEPFSTEYRLTSRDGRPIWFHDEAVVVRDEQGNPLFLHGIMLEVNERKQAEENLRHYAVRLTLLNELGQQIAAELDIEGVLTQAAYLVREGFGYHHVALFTLDRERDELVMRACAGSYGRLFTPGRRLKIGQGMVGWVAQHGERLLANDVTREPRYANVDPDITTSQSELSVPIRTGGEVVGVLDVQSPQSGAFDNNDIQVMETLADQVAVAIKNARLYATLAQERASLARRVEERTAELSLANAELARAARLKDEFLANMSHELRTPLNAVLGLSEALSEEVYGPLTERQTKSLRDIGEAGHHLLNLVNDILDVAKAEAGKLELQTGPVSVRDLCQASLGMVRQMAHKKRLQVSNAIDGQVTVIEADQRRLKQVLVNLLSNAVKFTPEGGSVGLEVIGNKETETVHLVVWDTGIGISEENMGRLFQPFVQLDGGLSRQYAGTGLGLSLVRRLVDLHGGGISVQSQVGQGSRFTVSLPWIVSPEEPQAATFPSRSSATTVESVAAHRHGAQTAPLILLAEDNPVNVSTFRDYLLARGYQVVVARNGLEAIECANERQPDLILMDIQMPEMDGLTAIRRLRANAGLAQVPIVALTALAMPGDRGRCIDAGANDYLSKPVGMKQLILTVERSLAPVRGGMNGSQEHHSDR